MQSTTKPRAELERARAAIVACRAARSFAEFEEHWREFLRRLERVWNKSEAHYRRSPKWGGWKGRYVRLRRDDQLLLYLCQARGAEEHTIADVMQHEPGSMAIKAGPSGMLHIQSLEIRNGRIVDLQCTGEPPIIEITPSRAKLLPVTNRGRTYAPPERHLDAAIDPSDALQLAELAVRFYDDFLTKTDAEFVK